MTMHHHDHDDQDDCIRALQEVHAFLHGELMERDADLIRLHLHACEKCMDQFDIESTITKLVQRSHRAPAAPSNLRARITSMRISRHP